MKTLATSALSEINSTQLLELPASQGWDIEPTPGSSDRETGVKSCLSFEDEADTLSIIFHSSGSSGFPKVLFCFPSLPSSSPDG